MTALVWGREEDRISFRGVDRGVLYPENSPGVAWDGLVAIDEIPLSGDAEEYYFEGISYLQLVESLLAEPFAPDLPGVVVLQAGHVHCFPFMFPVAYVITVFPFYLVVEITGKFFHFFIQGSET